MNIIESWNWAQIELDRINKQPYSTMEIKYVHRMLPNMEFEHTVL